MNDTELAIIVGVALTAGYIIGAVIEMIRK